MYNASRTPEERQHIMTGMCATDDRDRLRKVLDFAISPDVAPEDLPFLLTCVAKRKLGRLQAWNFFVQHRNELFRRYETNLSMKKMIMVIH